MTARLPVTLLAATVLGLLAAIALAPSRALAQPMEIRIEAGLLTLEVRDAPLVEVLRAIGSQAGFEVFALGAPDPDALVSASLAGVPVREALEHILRGTNRVLVHGAEQGTIARLWLLGPGTRGPEPAAVTPPDIDDDLPHDTDAKSRSEAVLALAADGPSEHTLRALIAALLEDEHPLVRARAAMALGHLGDQAAVAALGQATTDVHGSVRTQAVQALGLIGGDEATRFLGAILLRGSERHERVAAAMALGRQNTVLAGSFLDAAAHDPDAQVSMAARAQIGPGHAQPSGRPGNRAEH